MPGDWRKALVIPVHKKGSKLICKNYRGISLLSIPGKVYAKILDQKMRDITVYRKDIGRTGRIPKKEKLYRPTLYCQNVEPKDY